MRWLVLFLVAGAQAGSVADPEVEDPAGDLEHPLLGATAAPGGADLVRAWMWHDNATWVTVEVDRAPDATTGERWFRLEMSADGVQRAFEEPVRSGDAEATTVESVGSKGLRFLMPPDYARPGAELLILRVLADVTAGTLVYGDEAAVVPPVPFSVPGPEPTQPAATAPPDPPREETTPSTSEGAPPSAAPVPATDFGVNVVRAADRGCSDDGGFFDGEADLRVHVSVDGRPLLTTHKAQDEEAPIYGAVASVTPPAAITVRAEEADGAFTTYWSDCDLGDGRDFTFHWDGSLMSVEAGGMHGTASVWVVAGPNPPAAPTVTVEATADTAQVRWPADPRARGQDAVVVPGAYHFTEGTGGEARLEGLCDAFRYRVAVERVYEPWLTRDAVTFTTANLPPPPAVITSVDESDGRAQVHWAQSLWHDGRWFEVHVGPAPTFEPDQTTYATGRFVSRHDVSYNAGVDLGDEEVVRVVTEDEGGLQSVSAPAGKGHRAEAALTAYDCVPTGVTPSGSTRFAAGRLPASYAVPVEAGHAADAPGVQAPGVLALEVGAVLGVAAALRVRPRR